MTRVILLAFLVASLQAADTHAATADARAWNSKAAAAYLDGRMAWWISWPSATRDHETFCVSCHTAVPYAMARPALRAVLAERDASPNERKLLANVTRRVRLWKDVQPFYPDETRGVPKTAESRGTEAILNALILAGQGDSAGQLSPDARLAFDNMWEQQLKTGDDRGAWPWLQFHNSPWEGDSQYYGATLAAVALATAPESYRSSADIEDRTKLLRDYLARKYESEILLNRVMVLWASAKVPGLLTGEQRKAIMQEVVAKQQADGGFSLSSFVGEWKRRDGTPLETKSDGYATGLVALALEQGGAAAGQASRQRALTWLTLNQDRADGRWLAYSLNKQRDLLSDIGRFMSDAATAYAVLALTSAK